MTLTSTFKKTNQWMMATLFLTTFSLNLHAASTALIDKVQNSQDINSETGPKEVLVDFRELAKKAIPAVVFIKVETKQKKGYLFGGDEDSNDYSDFFGDSFWKFFNIPKDGRSRKLVGQASGVIVDPKGYILTNSHVVKDMDNITVLLNDGREFSAKVLGDDPNSDLALIKIDATDLPFLKLGDSNKLEVGQWVAAIGNPFGLQATLTAGIISAKSRNNLDIVPTEDFIQTDASINAGNSGGPLMTLDGQIAGINTAIATNSSAGDIGIGFAIPSNMAKFVMDEILKNGKVSRGYLGVTLQTIDYHLAQAFELPKVEGALVTSVLKGSPAETAGIKTEDIILKYNDQKVENAASLRNIIYMMHPGTKIKLTLIRDGKQIEVPAEIGQFAEEKKKEKETPILGSNAIGIEVENLTPEVARNGDQGVVISKVLPSSPASFAGLKKGTLILAVNRQKIENKDQFDEALKSAKKGRPLLLQIKQGDVTAFISIQLN